MPPEVESGEPSKRQAVPRRRPGWGCEATGEHPPTELASPNYMELEVIIDNHSLDISTVYMLTVVARNGVLHERLLLKVHDYLIGSSSE